MAGRDYSSGETHCACQRITYCSATVPKRSRLNFRSISRSNWRWQFTDFYSESAHNIFLDALTAKGIFGLASMLALTALCLRYARGPMGGAFVAMLVRAAIHYIHTADRAVLLPHRCNPMSDFEIEAALVSRVPARRNWWPAVFAIPFLGMAIISPQATRCVASARRALDRDDFDSAWALQDRARAWMLAADVYFSRRYSTISNERARVYAQASALRATQTAEDRQNALTNLAAFQSPSGDAAAVERTLRSAVAAAPNWYKSHWLLAQVLWLEGRIPEARAEAQTAVDRGGGRHPEVQATLNGLLAK